MIMETGTAIAPAVAAVIVSRYMVEIYCNAFEMFYYYECAL
jgi:hypothetical protein